MADRIEREINEIFEKLEGLPNEGAAPERRPISLAEARQTRAAPAARTTPSLPSIPLSPTHALLAGAGTVIGGLVLSNLWAPLIWAAFGGVAVFLAGFVGALFRRPKTPAKPREGVFWRDRYIEYSAQPDTALGRLRRRWRK